MRKLPHPNYTKALNKKEKNKRKSLRAFVLRVCEPCA